MTGESEPLDWSLPDTAVLGAVRDAVDGGRTPVLVTVASVDGSAYRRPGAKMMLDDEGSAGSVTAGCLTDSVRKLAADVRASGRPRLERFDLTDDEVWGLGLGCNGVIDLFVEPVGDQFRPLLEAHAAGEDGVGVVVVDASADSSVSVGDRVYAPAGDLSSVDTLPGWLREELGEQCRTALEADQSVTASVTGPAGDSIRVLLDPLTAPPDLYVFGSGNDVHPVTELATRAGFRVTVVPFRGGRAASDQFPDADRVVATNAPEVGETLAYDEDTYVVVMSHNAVDDRLAIAGLLETAVPYIGLMGPTDRFDDITEALAEEGRSLSERELDRIYTPIGIDLGGDSPYHIALSIVSELLAVHNERRPGHLRDRGSPIHERPQRPDR